MHDHASLRATATVARFMPRRLATDMLQAPQAGRLARGVISTVPALYSRCCSIRSPHLLMCPDLSISPVRGHRHGRARRTAQDAHGIVEMMRLDHYRPVNVKSPAAQSMRTTLTAAAADRRFTAANRGRLTVTPQRQMSAVLRGSPETPSRTRRTFAANCSRP
jgi:hypothetical protein